MNQTSPKKQSLSKQIVDKAEVPIKAVKSSSIHAKKRILIAASDLFAGGGIGALSVRSIADKAGVSTIGMYSHFKGKQGLLDALFIEGYQMVYDTMGFSHQGLSPKQILLQGIKGYLLLAQEYEGHYRLIFGENGNQYTPSDEAKEMSLTAFRRLVKHSSVILQENADWQLKQKIALELWAFVHGYVSLKHHASSALISQDHWHDMAVDGITTHIDALVAKFS